MTFERVQPYDERWVMYVCGLWRRWPTLNACMMVIARWTPIVMVCVIAAAALSQTSSATRLAGFSAIAAAVLARAINELVTRVFRRPRPFERLSFLPLLAHERGGSFPSNHATGAFALAVSMTGVPGVGLILFVLAVLLAISRVYVGLHYPTDVLAGVLHGTFVAVVVSTAVSVWLA
ncbi:phosphatase PAP2 family protein [Alicyclobacillus shizuokensis]|uniref:phosphatase PAP2 family protein n=1 Tax=Alicyclobacillus shizuokensis TaxID=392014 RepID=UPI0008353AA9|nr:phosphatase PAP2 family protein [Alicyclobacillus shizuokensis]MCL6626725.1 phosphatase PAP2 family protein [Alicyclobacillus shizuokensis]